MGLKQMQKELQQSRQQESSLIADLTTALEAAKVTNNQLQQENSSLKAELAEAYRKIQSLNNSDLELQKAEQLKASAKELNEMTKQRQTELQTLKSSLELQKKELDRREQQLQRQQQNLDQKVIALEIEAKQKAEKEVADTKKELKERLLDVSKRENSLDADMETCKKQALQAAQDAVAKREADVKAREKAVAKREADVNQDIDKKTEQILQSKTKKLDGAIWIGVILLLVGSFATGFAESVIKMLGVTITQIGSIYDWWCKPVSSIWRFSGLVICVILYIVIVILALFFAILGYYPFYSDDNSKKSLYSFFTLCVGAAIIVSTSWLGVDNAAWYFVGCGIILGLIRLMGSPY